MPIFQIIEVRRVRIRTLVTAATIDEAEHKYLCGDSPTTTVEEDFLDSEGNLETSLFADGAS